MMHAAAAATTPPMSFPLTLIPDLVEATRGVRDVDEVPSKVI